jgi:hypothetical protein
MHYGNLMGVLFLRFNGISNMYFIPALSVTVSCVCGVHELRILGRESAALVSLCEESADHQS